MSTELDELAAQAVRNTPTSAPPVGQLQRRAKRLQRRRFGTAAIAMASVAALVGLGAWAATSTESDDGNVAVAGFGEPREAGTNSSSVPTVTAPTVTGSFGWPAPARGFQSAQALADAFAAEILGWPSSEVEAPASETAEPTWIEFANADLDREVRALAIPSPQGWGFVQIGDAGGGMSQTSLEFDRPTGTASTAITIRSIDAVFERVTDGSSIDLPAGLGPFDIVSTLQIHYNGIGDVIGVAGGGDLNPTSAGTPPTTPSASTEAGAGRSDLPVTAQGVLPNGQAYEVRSNVPSGNLRSISALIVLDVDRTSSAFPQLVGSFGLQRAADQTSTANNEAGTVTIVSGDWALTIQLHAPAIAELGDEAATLVLRSISAVEPADGSGLPAFELEAPLRWATDDELPHTMAVSYSAFAIQRGCSEIAVVCSSDESLQVLATNPSEPWSGGDIEIQTR